MRPKRGETGKKMESQFPAGLSEEQELFEVKASEIRGLKGQQGLFAKKDFARKQKLLQYCGEIITLPELIIRESIPGPSSSYAFQYKDERDRFE